MKSNLSNLKTLNLYNQPGNLIIGQIGLLGFNGTFNII